MTNLEFLQMIQRSKMSVNEQYVSAARSGDIRRVRELLRRGVVDAHNDAIRVALKVAGLPRPDTPFWKKVEKRAFAKYEKIIRAVMDAQKKSDYDNVRDLITPDFVFTMVNTKLSPFRDLLYEYMGDDLVQKTTLDFVSQSKVIKMIMTTYQRSYSEGDVILLGLACAQNGYTDTWNVIKSFSLKTFQRSSEEKKRDREIVKSGRIPQSLLPPGRLSFDIVCEKTKQKIVRIVKNV